MAADLEKLADKRMRFMAEFVRYGSKPGFRRGRDRTLLLRDIRRADTNEVVAGEQWFSQTREFAAIAPLRAGERVAFDARVAPSARSPLLFSDYLRRDLALNYKLSRPTKVCKLP